MSGPAFFTFALGNLTSIQRNMSVSVRTLPDAQLAAEIDQLALMRGDLSVDMMLGIYRQEAERRTSPEHAFDDELDQALFRLERQTSTEDRHFVEEVGRRLYRTGGWPALNRAITRMVELATPTRRGLRASILAKRWPIPATETSR
jgi:hypothetical protein